MKPRKEAQIGPTAHYTGFVWHKNQLSYPGLATPRGALLYHLVSPWDRAHEILGPSAGLESTLLQRHRILDHLLEKKIESGEIQQIVELACGLSPRGLRFSQKYPHVPYIEADLPSMAELKASRVRSGRGHKILQIDVRKTQGWQQLSQELRSDEGIAVVTEGLVNYLDLETLRNFWKELARFLTNFPRGWYFSDIHTEVATFQTWGSQIFRKSLDKFIQGRTHFPFPTDFDVEIALKQAGFALARVSRPEEFWAMIPDLKGSRKPSIVRILSAGQVRKS